jgi:carboxypeptidase T
MNRVFRSLLVLVGLVLLSGATGAPQKKYYVEVALTSLRDIRAAHLNNLDVGGVNWDKRLMSLVVSEEQLRRLPRGLRLVSQREVQAPDERYKRYNHVASYLKEVERRFPQLAKVYVIGHSLEGKEILAIHLTDQAHRSREKESVLFNAMHHAREVMTAEVAVDIINYLTQGVGRDRRVAGWLSKYNIWVVPMLNPDGNERVWTSDTMWRKNTRDGHGVDINRNYAYDWGKCSGSSGSKGSPVYRGAAPASEPETQALINLATRIRPKFSISYHSYSELVIYPFGCDPKRVPADDAAVYYKVGKDLAQKLTTDSGKGTYRVGTSYELLYNVDGGDIDWLYDNLKTMAFVIEVNSTSAGFQPPYSLRDPTVIRQRPGWQFILDSMDGTRLPSRP